MVSRVKLQYDDLTWAVQEGLLEESQLQILWLSLARRNKINPLFSPLGKWFDRHSGSYGVDPHHGVKIRPGWSALPCIIFLLHLALGIRLGVVATLPKDKTPTSTSSRRLLYHSPTIAVMDECTSAVCSDLEAFLYHELKQRGTSCITVSHRRRTLWRFHDYLLQLYGDGSWEYQQIDQQKEEALFSKNNYLS